MWILMRDEKVRKGDAGWGVAFLNFRMKQNAPVTHFIACELLLAIIFLTCYNRFRYSCQSCIWL